MSGIMIGRKFGNLTVIDHCMNTDVSSNKLVCRCDCGNIVEVFATNLYAGRTVSCGCKKRTHGESKTPLYRRFCWIKHVGCSWDTFEDYKRFLEANGVDLTSDFRVKRIDKSKPFTEDNCVIA